MKMNKVIAASVLAMAVTGPALAGGMPTVSEEVPMQAEVVEVVTPMYSSDWSGFYGGASLGHGQGNSGAQIGDAEGMTYGVFGGYQADLGNVVVGGELEYSATDMSDAGTGVDVSNEALAKVRVGYDAGQFLPYAVAGVSQMDLGGASSDSDNGYVYGVGVDYQMTDSLRLGAEVLDHRYDDFAGSGSDEGFTSVGLRASLSF